MPAAETLPEVASVAAIRSHFPALERTEGGSPVAFFDGPGGTQVPRAVADAVTDYLLDHNANVDPWRALEKEKGIVVKAVPLLRGTAALDLDAFARLLGKRTRLVAVGGASNAVGTINDVVRIAAAARANDSLVFVDAVHYAPHVLVDVKALGADFLACSPYKFYGPHAGVLWGRRELIEKLDVPKLRPAPCLLYTSPSPRDRTRSRMPSSA